MDHAKNYWETPMMTYWRRLNAELERLGAKPVLFGEACAVYGSWRDPRQGARFGARAQGIDVAAPILPPDL